jgi:hypothetical protein
MLPVSKADLNLKPESVNSTQISYAVNLKVEGNNRTPKRICLFIYFIYLHLVNLITLEAVQILYHRMIGLLVNN